MQNQALPKTLIGLVRTSAPFRFALSLLLGLGAGVGYSFLIPYLMKGLQTQVEGQSVNSGSYIAVFFILCIGIVIARAASLIIANRVVKDISARMRITLCKKMQLANVRTLEKFGQARLINVLMDDIGSISYAAVCVPMLCIEIVTIAGLLAYIAYVDWLVFLVVAISLALGTMAFHLPMRLSSSAMNASRNIRDRVQQGIRGVLFGAYELKLDPEKAHHYLEEEINAPEWASTRLDKKADAIMLSAGNFGCLLSFLVIGLAAFVLPAFVRIDNVHLYGIVMVLLYLIGPIAMALNLTQPIQRGNIGLAHIADVYHLEEENFSSNSTLSDWSTFSASDLRFHYEGGQSEHDNGFYVGPISLSFQRGEIVYIVGGNGSGKTTLAKLLSLHYLPDSGALHIDRVLIDSNTIAAARNRIAVIYSHYHLFDGLYRDLSAGELEHLQSLLRMFALEGKTEFKNGKFSTTELSDGQRRRLALVVALMQDRDMYLFDEWAADQDPEFKERFYRDVLPMLKKKNKLVIVISHDDRYFQAADRLVYMENGCVRKVQVVKELSSTKIDADAEAV